MDNAFLIKWSIWIGGITGIYVLLFALSPLAAYGVMPATFVAFPLYFLAGASNEDFLGFASSAVIGVGWGALYLFLIGLLIGWGMNAAVTMALVVGVLTIILCAVHFCLTTRLVFNKVPMMFGAIACTFFVGMEKAVPLMITLVLGMCLAWACRWGGDMLGKMGKKG